MFSLLWDWKKISCGDLVGGGRLRGVLVSAARKGPFAHPGQIPLCPFFPVMQMRLFLSREVSSEHKRKN